MRLQTILWAVTIVAMPSFISSFDGLASQERYPARPMLLTHGFAVGVVAEGLSPHLGQPVAVEPRPGAGGNTASTRLLQSAPDGYTLVSLTGAHAISAAVYKSLPFDPLDDFQMISTYGYFAFLIAESDQELNTAAPSMGALVMGKLRWRGVL